MELTAALWFDGSTSAKANLSELRRHLPAENIILCHPKECLPVHGGPCVEVPSPTCGRALNAIFEKSRSRIVLIFLRAGEVILDANAISKAAEALTHNPAAIAYGAYFIKEEGKPHLIQPLIDYQPGSLRDDFDFGQLLLLDLEKARRLLAHYKYKLPEDFTALYGLRLFACHDALPLRFSQPAYALIKRERTDSEKEHFRYVEAGGLEAQKKFERTFTFFAKRTGFFLPKRTATCDFDKQKFPVEASVVIPVKNRAATVQEAVLSALSQKANFDFNVIVIDNHSEDGTTEKLAELAQRHKNLVHVVPSFTTLAIGGCWNEALFHARAGKFCVQLDSDDLYSSADVVQRIVNFFHKHKVAAVVGSYKLVNSRLEEIPPGVIDHREWSDENGHNNALRINGFGAPRAYFTPVAREIRFPNVSYGEDYAMMLAISRSYAIGRIYDVLYHCRRWEGNSDASPSLEKINAFNTYKDGIRSQEIKRRKEIQASK